MSTTQPTTAPVGPGEIREVKSRQDSALGQVFDIYQKSFPLTEQMLISFFLDFLTRKEAGEAEEFRLEVLEVEGRVVAFAFYESGSADGDLGNSAYLWYLAVNPDVRGGGYGKRMYFHVLNTAFTQFDARALLYEIETPEDVEGEEGKAYAEWRSGWYRSMGAKALLGTRYLCGVDWQPPVPMQVMVHANGPLTAEEALALARATQDEGIEQTGPLSLE
jgi:GNAT superfamily N-acetyltransferase